MVGTILLQNSGISFVSVAFLPPLQRKLQLKRESFSCVLFSPSPGTEAPPERVSFPQLLSLLRLNIVGI